MKDKKTLRIAAYLRVSTADQSLELQRNEIVNYCSARNFSDITFYEDFALSGSRTDNRPAFKKLCSDAAQRKFDILIAFKLDRVGRSLIDVISFLNRLAELQIDFIAIRDAIDMTSNSSSSRLMISLIASFAEYERSIIRERTIAGLIVARKKGKTLGRPKQRNDAQIFELHKQGLSCRTIADKLNTSAMTISRALKARVT